MDTKKLRQKILDLAIHGKLVPQDPNDEPASVLLERIRAEKERMIKEGKIKCSRKTTKTSDATCDGYIPKGWSICTLGEMFTLQAGKNITAKFIGDILTKEQPYKCYGGNGVRGFVASYNKEGYFPIIGRQGALCGNVNMAEGKFYATEHAVVVESYCGTDVKWAYYALASLNLNQYATATAQPGLSVAVISDINIQIPPLKEQVRISKTIERWFKLIDIIEQGKADLQTTIKQAKNKILDLAIHGKLVPQDPNDESASELLKRINPKAEITCDNGHYKQLPYNWHWLKGKDRFSPMKSIKPSGEDFLYIDIESIDNKKQIINEVKNIKTANAPSRASRYTKKGDVVFSMVRPYLRNIAKIERDNCIVSTGFFVCSPVKEILLSTYCYYLMISSYVVDGLNHFMKGDNSPSINKKDIDEWLFPIPPIAEQLRIVDKIEKLLLPLSEIQKTLEM